MQGNRQSMRIAIIGGGFGGIGAAIKLREAGYESITIFEKASDVGGCWRDNSYPGAACDVPSHLYSFSFEPKHDWSRKYAPQAEIYGYLQHCVDKYGLRRHFRFGTEIESARFDESRALWRLQTAAGESVEAQVLITACGQLNRPVTPRLPGIERFGGEVFHSAQWRHDLDLSGRRVAVVGTGASAIQFVPRLATKVASLSLFQRSAPYIIPKPDRRYSRREQNLYRRFPWLQRLSRAWQYCRYEARVLAFARILPLMPLVRVGFERHLKRQVADPELRKKLRPDYPIGCKRILISNDYYPAITSERVELVTEPIREITETAVVTQDGRAHEVDTLIYGTGFAATEFLAPMKIEGLGGHDLNVAWRDGAEAYLGISVSGFPNLFMLYGPNTNLGHNSIVYMIESQLRFVLQAIGRLRDGDNRSLDVRADRQSRFNERLQQSMRRTVWAQGCDSWYQTATGRHTNNWPGFTFSYRHRTAKFDASAYRDPLGTAP